MGWDLSFRTVRPSAHVHFRLARICYRRQAVKAVDANPGLSRKIGSNVDFGKCKYFVYNLINVKLFLEWEVFKETSQQLRLSETVDVLVCAGGRARVERADVKKFAATRHWANPNKSALNRSKQSGANTSVVLICNMSPPVPAPAPASVSRCISARC